MASRPADPAWPAPAVVGLVFGLDLLWSTVGSPTGALAYGLVDVPAHFLTCLVALLAVAAVTGRRLSAPFVAAALLASIAIDVDHIPAYLGSHALTGSLPRPYSHGLLTVAVMLAAGRALHGDARQIAFGLAFGVAAHLARDLGTGPGVSLFWPLADASIVIPYAVYAAALSLSAAAIAVRVRRGSGQGRPARRRPVVRPLPDAGQPGGP